MELSYSNIEYPSGRSSDGRSIFDIEYPSGSWLDGCLTFEYRISILEVVRWTFDIRISNIHLGAGQMEHLKFEYQIYICEVIRWTLDIGILNIHL